MYLKWPAFFCKMWNENISKSVRKRTTEFCANKDAKVIAETRSMPECNIKLKYTAFYGKHLTLIKLINKHFFWKIGVWL